MLKLFLFKQTMINIYRYLDIYLFFNKNPLIIAGLTILPGWNQVIRIEDNYKIKQLQHQEYYGTFPVSEGHILIANTLHCNN